MESQARMQKAKMARKEQTSKQQFNVATRPLVGSQQSASSNSSSSQQKQMTRDSKELPVETPCKEIAAMRINGDGSQKKKKNKTKRKLLGSKSLSQLVPINFFSKKGHDEKPSSKQEPLPTTKSFPNAAFNFHNEFISNHIEQDQQEASNQSGGPGTLPLRQVQSSSMIGMQRQSTSNPLIDFYPNTPSSSTTLASTTNLSPIVANSCSRNIMVRSVVASTPTNRKRGSKSSAKSENDTKAEEAKACEEKEEKEQQKQEAAKEAKPENRYKTLKNTALVLRDVKNSIGLRMKAKHESKAFAKLTNEVSTPPTKLYSPFNIYTPGCSGMETGNELDNSMEFKLKQKQKSKRKLNNKKNRAKQHAVKDINTTSDSVDDSGFNGSLSLTAGHGDESMTTNYRANNDKTPKNRIALRHKKHLMQANAFAAFESPAGRLRETVKDVEQFQQCIEDISLAIRARGQLI